MNTRALIDAIESGKVADAAIDVIENDHRYFHQDHRLDVLNNHDLTLLRSFPNVVVTPHIAFYSDTVTAEMVHCAMEYLRDFSQTGEPLMEVHPD
ncbi:MAG: lactate dehydrogenase [Cutibacterium sp.]|nr:lactate dehydrogenase [Cutibacterium sp.]